MKNQKKILTLVHSKKTLIAYVIVGLVYSVISVAAPSISGDLVNSVIYGQGNIKFYLILLILTYLLLFVLSVVDQHAFMSFKIKEKKAGYKKENLVYCSVRFLQTSSREQNRLVYKNGVEENV